MHTTNETPVLDLCENAGDTFWRSKHHKGLSAEIVVSHDDGPLLRVSTGGHLSSRFVPAGTNTPLQVQASYTIVDGRRVERGFSTSYEFGARRPVPADLDADIRWVTDDLVETIVATSPSFADRWDAAIRGMNAARILKAAEKESKGISTTMGGLAAVITEALAVEARRVGTPAPSLKDIERHPALEELAKLVPSTPPSELAEDGRIVQCTIIRTVAARASEVLARGDRLTETEFLSHCVDEVLSRNPSADLATTSVTAQAAYDLMHTCVYGAAGFPDAQGA